MTASSTPAMQSVFSNGRCIGFVWRRRANEFEAFDRDARSIGMFDNLERAVAAVFKQQGGEK